MHKHFILLVAGLLLLTGCTLGGSEMQPGPSLTNILPSQTTAPTEMIRPEESDPVTKESEEPIEGQSQEENASSLLYIFECSENPCEFDQAVQFSRPISSGFVDWVDQTYPFGSTASGKYEVHHGVEFINPSGTKVRAVETGIVMVAGNDRAIPNGLSNDFYGNLVIIEHQLDALSEPLYTVYGHLSKVMVEAGQEVQQGDVIGLVGATGYAIGSHLHFEVRFGTNQYDHTVNPVLWLSPRVTDSGDILGNLVGVVVDRWGELVVEKQMTVEALQRDDSGRYKRYYPTTYADPALTSVSPYHENFSLADLPEGDYRISVVNGKLYETTISIRSGRTTFLMIRVP